ncbi:hypothetical protein AB656_06210 [Bifidobacterium actinocoloniiforme DSM 22766]|nr:hypothetical protein AB656_05860 [Bifidobacterium actinocoloniiforme DSM 22766]AKV55817.1 hypothetical protein AB656_06210 [Bifidobacterium actinocoloniiforme DSM 22766]
MALAAAVGRARVGCSTGAEAIIAVGGMGMLLGSRAAVRGAWAPSMAGWPFVGRVGGGVVVA